MGIIKGTIIQLKDFLFDKESQITYNFNDQHHVAICFNKNRVLNVPDYQREIRWEKETLLVLMNDIVSGDKYLGNIILSKIDGGNYDIIDGQQRIVSLLMLIDYIKHNYSNQINDIGELVKLNLNGFSEYSLFRNKVYKLDKSDKDYEKIVKSDFFEQTTALSNLFESISKSGILSNQDKARKFWNNLRNCKLNVIIAEQQDSVLSAEYYLDVNVKGVQLDDEDIFKGYLFAYDSSGQIRSDWVKLKRNWFKYVSVCEEKRKIPIPFMKLLEHYFWCEILSLKNYMDVNMSERFTLISECEVNGSKYYSGDHIIKVVNDNSIMLKTIQNVSEYCKFLQEVVNSVDNCVTLNNGLHKIELDAKKTVFNFIKKIIVDRNLIVPKSLVMKYFFSVIKKENANKKEEKSIFNIYFFWTLFMLFMNKNKPDAVKNIVKSENYISQVDASINSFLNDKTLFEYKKNAFAKCNSNFEDEDLQYKCKALATIYNYYYLDQNGKIVFTDKKECPIVEFLNDSNKYSIEHFIVNQSNVVKYIVNKCEYEYPIPKELLTYKKYIFNFIFLPKQINNEILKDFSLSRKISVLLRDENYKQIKCKYSLMIIDLLKDGFNIDVEVAESQDCLQRLNNYWYSIFPDDYQKFSNKVIDNLIKRFKK